MPNGPRPKPFHPPKVGGVPSILPFPAGKAPTPMRTLSPERERSPSPLGTERSMIGNAAVQLRDGVAYGTGATVVGAAYLGIGALKMTPDILAGTYNVVSGMISGGRDMIGAIRGNGEDDDDEVGAGGSSGSGGNTAGGAETPGIGETWKGIFGKRDRGGRDRDRRKKR